MERTNHAIAFNGTHIAIEAWNVNQEQLKKPQELLAPTVAFLDQLNLTPHAEMLQYQFEKKDGYEEAASLFVATQQPNKALTGFVGLHPWTEYGYLSLEFKDNQPINPREVVSAFAEAYKPGSLIGERPPDKLAHLVMHMTVPKRNWQSVPGRMHLKGLHNEVIQDLKLNPFDKQLWEVESDRETVMCADGLKESHLVSEMRRHKVGEHHSLATVVLSTCTGIERIKRAPGLIKNLYDAVGEPVVNWIDYYGNDSDNMIQNTFPGIIARLIPNPRLRTIHQPILIADFEGKIPTHQGNLPIQLPY